MRRVLMAVRHLSRDIQGQDLLEYGFLMALIAVFAIGAIQTLGNTVNSVLWTFIVSSF